MDPAFSSRTQYARAKILDNHIHRVLGNAPETTRDRISQSLALDAAMRIFSKHADDDARAPGGLSQNDLTKLSPVPPPELSGRLCQQLEDELRATLLSISEYLSPGELADADDETRLDTASRLPERVRERREAIAQQEASLRECRARVLALIARINDAHPALEAKLVQALTVLPPQLRAARAAEADVVAATIEAALVKLSLVRARAHRALYGYAPPRKDGAGHSSEATVARAVGEMYARLKDRQRAQEVEMEGLDRQISDYEGMLSLVDGTDGSFAQVVRDMARVKRETEECRKDLRRLGWTGD